MRINLPVSSINHPVPDGEVLVSKTDLKGIVTYCNRPFCQVSGYSERELLGEPHNRIRHPDVPPEIFSDCWKTIQSGQPWNGVIKNRCKNGDYYWVEANITPWIEQGRHVGYVSLRYKATAQQIAAAEELYRALRSGPAGARPASKFDTHYIVDLQQRLAEKILALEKYYDQTEDEMRIGSDIMTRINDAHSTQDPMVQMKISPAAHYSGDLILISRTPSDNLHILLADAVGHGLTAAMNLLPLSQVFNAMSKKGFTVSRIAEELNSKINKLMPVDRFIGALIISIDFREQVIEVWNGGIPAPLLIAKNGGILHRWPSRNLPLGILGEEAFSAEVEAVHYEQDSQLFLFSDGLPEAESPNGEQYGKDRIERLLQQTAPEQRFEQLISSLEEHLHGHPAHDDVSLAMVAISLVSEEKNLVCALSSPTDEELHSKWKVALKLGADELKYLDAVPLLTEVIGKIHATVEHHSALYVILTELFNNALDHGVLRLDSALKHGPDGFENYLRQREEKLNALSSGSIEIEIEMTIIEGHYGVRMRVVDSGKGFDYSAPQPASLDELGPAQHGRGLLLARGLAFKIEHIGSGNEVVAYYICS